MGRRRGRPHRGRRRHHPLRASPAQRHRLNQHSAPKGLSEQRRFQQEYYDRHYPKRVAAVRDQLAHPLFRSFYDRLADRLIDNLPADRSTPGPTPARIFEVGCGEGFLGSAILRRAAARCIEISYAGTDLSAAALDLARPTLGDELIVGDATDVAAGLPASSADLVIVKNLLHHLDDPGALLVETARMVGPSGRVAVVEARLGCPQFLLFSGLAPRREKYFFAGARRNRAAIAAAGLRVVHSERYSFLPYELAFHIRPGWFRRLFRTDDPKTIARVTAVDDRLARILPWFTSYVLWITAPFASDTAAGGGATSPEATSEGTNSR